MYTSTSFLSPAKACSDPRTPPRVTKKVPWAGQGLSPKKRLPTLTLQSKVVTSPSVLSKTSLLKDNIPFQTGVMEFVLRKTADDIWASLGPGYSESVYHCAFEVALRSLGVYYETERIVPVYYAGQNVGHVRADLIVDRKAVIELKSVGRLSDGYRIQTQNYLQLLDLNEGYLINFPDKKGSLEFEVITRDKPAAPTPDQIDC